MTSDDRSRGIRRAAVGSLVVATALLVLVAVAGGAAASENVDGCRIIDDAGSYELTQNVTGVDTSQLNESACIDVRANDVIVDGNGYLLDSDHDENTDSQRGVYVNGTEARRDNVTVTDVEVTDWPRGVRAQNATGVRVENISARTRNADDAGGWYGVYLTGVSNSTVTKSEFDEYNSAISARSSNGPNNNNRFFDNEVQGIGSISIHNGANTTVRDNDLTTDPSTTWGIDIDGNGGTVSNNDVDGGSIWTDGTDLTVENNTVRNTEVTISSGTNNKHYAVEIDGSSHDVRNNTVEDTVRGLAVSGTDHVLRDNEMRNNRENFHTGVYSDSDDTDFDSLDIDTSNTVDEEPIYLFTGESGHTFDETDAGYLAYADSTDVTVRDVEFRNNTQGLFLHDVSNLTVENVTMSENSFGIYSRESEGVSIRDSQFEDNTLNGIQADTSSDSDPWSLENVDVVDNGIDADRSQRTEGNAGVYFCCANVTIDDSNVTHNANGIAFGTGSSNVTLQDSVVSENDGDGVWMQEELDFRGYSEFVDNEISNNGKNGIIAYTGTARFANNTLLENDESGLRIAERGSTERTSLIRNNTARNNRYGIALYKEDVNPALGVSPMTVDDNVLVDNEVTDNQHGVYVSGRAENNTIRGNNATGNSENGIYLENVGNHHVVDNDVSTNGGDGVYFHDYHGDREMDMDAFVVRNNTAVSNNDDGIELDNARASNDPSGPFVVRENLVRKSGDVGVGVQNSENVSIADNGRVNDSGGTGIDVSDSDNVSVVNHSVTGNGVGLSVVASEATVENLTATDNDGTGIGIEDTDRVDIAPDVTADGNGGDGIRIVDGADLDLPPDVTADENGDDGIYVEGSHDVRVSAGSTSTNGLSGIAFVDSWDSTVRDHEANDNWRAGIRIEDNGDDQENITVRNVTARRNGVGIDVDNEDGTTVANSTITDSNASKGDFTAITKLFEDESIPVNGTGIVGDGSSDATFVDNTIANNDGKGVVMTRNTRDSWIEGNDLEDNGGNGVEFVDANGTVTVENNTITDNGGTELYPTISVEPNGNHGVYIESSSNISLLNNTVESNDEHGVRMEGDNDDNVLEGNAIRSHATSNASGHGVFVEWFGTDFDYPSNNTIDDNEITDNDYGITLFHENATTVRENDIVANTIGVRFGSNTEPYNVQETTVCNEDGVQATRNEFTGSSDGLLADNRIEDGDTGLKVVTHPDQITVCDGSVTSISYANPTVVDYSIENNYVNATEPINVSRSRLDYPSTTYDSELNGTNDWNASKTASGNVLGGQYRAGNYWAKPDGTGFSQNCNDSDGDGICDSNRTISQNNVDELPLAEEQPDNVVPGIASTNSPVVTGETLSVTATLTNTGEEQANRTANLSIDGSQTDQTSISLTPGESTTETFTWTTTSGDVGVHTATIASGDASASTEITVEPNVSVGVNGTNAPIAETETLEVEATVENNRGKNATETVELHDFDGDLVDSEDVTLEGDGTESLTLEWTPEAGDAGTDNVTVYNEYDEADAEVTVESNALESCTTITESGNYRLESDLSGSTCLEVQASNVSIDGQGHAINGSGEVGVDVNVDEGATETLDISNLTVRDVEQSVLVFVPEDGRVSDVDLTGITTESVEDGLEIDTDSFNGTVEGLTVRDSEFAADGSGITFSPSDEASFVDLAVKNTTITASDGVDIGLNYPDASLDGFELSNSTIDASGEGVSLETPESVNITDVRVSDTEINATSNALGLEYNRRDVSFESVRIEGNDLHSESENSMVLDGGSEAVTTRNVTISRNNLTAAGDGVDFTADGEDPTVESTHLRNNSVESAAKGMDLDLAGSGASYDVTVADNDVANFSEVGVDLEDVVMDPETNVTLRNNDVTNESGDVTGIDLRTSAGDATGNGTLGVANNTVRTGGDAIVVNDVESWNDPGPIDSINVSRNVLHASVHGVENHNNATHGQGDPVLNATNNYWGAADGPGSPDGDLEDPATNATADGNGSHVTAGDTEGVSNVRFDPYLETGDGSNVTTKPEVTVSPGSIDFEEVTVDSNATENVTVSNDGSASLDVSDVQVSGENSSAFAVEWSGQTVLGPSESTEIRVEFAPTSTGEKTADLTVENNDTDATVSLDGGGVAEEAYLQVAVDETNSPVTEGENLTVDATVENVGDLEATQTVTLSTNGTERDDTTVSLDGNETEAVNLSWATGNGDAGNYSATVATENDSASTEVSVDAVEPVDETPPAVDLTAIDANASAETPPDGRTVHTNGTVSFQIAANGTPGTPANVTAVLEAAETNFEHEIGANHGDDETWTATTNLSALPDDGDYSVNVTARDKAGNVNETAGDATIRLDREPPALGATVTRLDDGDGSVNVTTSEELAGAPKITVEDSNGTNATQETVDSGDTYWNATFDLDDDGGQYNVTASGTDEAGNAGTGTATTYLDSVETENNTSTVVLEPSGLFVNFTTDQAVNDSVVVTQSNTPLAPLAPGQAGVNFLNAQLGDVLVGNLSHATVGIPVDEASLPASVDEGDVTIRYYNETDSEWTERNTTVENRTIQNDTREYWVANVSQFSTYGAVASDDTAPTLEDATPSGELDAGTTAATVRFEYTDGVSGVDPAAVELSVDGEDVTNESATSVTGEYASYEATGLEAGTSYDATVTVADEAGNTESHEITFSIPDGGDDGDGEDTPEPTDGESTGGDSSGGGGSSSSGGTSATPTPAETVTPTSTPTFTTTTPTATDTSTPTATATESVDSPSSDDGAGFGPVVVLLALLAGLWLAGRRQ